MLFIPLESISIIKTVLGSATQAMGVMQGVGIGIASLFLLFVVFQYIAALLDGGKFQIKMLWPLAVYLIVCNFTLFVSPVVSFTTALQERSLESANGYKSRIISEFTHGKVSGDDASLWDAFMVRMDEDLDSVKDKEIENDLNGIEVTESVDESTGRKSFDLSNLFSGIGAALENFWKKIKQSFIESIVEPLSAFGTKTFKFMKWGLLGIVAQLFSWVCQFVELAVICLGGVMTGIIVTFGPITFAFAVFPGNSRVIGSWLIRLCQYALYSPIVALIQSFVYACLFSLGTGDGDGSITMLMALILCNVAALTSVPAIASMIIEGATGSISLSQGLQTAASTMGAATSIMMAGPRGGFKAVDFAYRMKERMANIGEKDRDDKMQHALDNIATSLNPGYQPWGSNGGGGGATGQNARTTSGGGTPSGGGGSA